MPSTFECPVCQSRYNKLLSSTYDAPSTTETVTYQCADCLNLFDIDHFLPETDDEEGQSEWVRAATEDGFFDDIYGKPRATP